MQTEEQKDVYQQSVIRHLTAQRNATADQLAHVSGLLAVANQTIAQLQSVQPSERAQQPPGAIPQPGAG